MVFQQGVAKNRDSQVSGCVNCRSRISFHFTCTRMYISKLPLSWIMSAIWGQRRYCLLPNSCVYSNLYEKD